MIRELEITPFQNRPAHALSGGQKKQVAIADILVMHPEIMILDEPASALDAAHTKKVHELIRGTDGAGDHRAYVSSRYRLCLGLGG